MPLTKEEKALFNAIYRNDIVKFRALLIEKNLKKNFFGNIKVRLEVKGDNNKTLLIEAALYNRANMVEDLVKAGANIMGQVYSFNSPLWEACSAHGCLQAVQALLNLGADPNQLLKSGGQYYTVIFVAARENNADVIAALAKAGAKINAINKERDTPLHFAALEGAQAAIEALIKNGANVNQVDNEGVSPLYGAAAHDRIGAIDVLLKGGANVNKPNYENKTPLWIAAKLGYIKTATALLSLPQIDITAKSRPGSETWANKTALEIAKMEGHQEIVKLITEFMKNSEGLRLKTELNNNAEQKELLKNQTTHASNLQLTKPTELNDDIGRITLSFFIQSEEISMGKKIGEGSFSVVYRGKYRFMDVAVKELKALSVSSDASQQFKNEVGIMAKVKSPFITRLYGACLTPPYRLVMEYLPKGSLYSVLHSNTPLSWEQRYQISLDMSTGLAHLHQENILHRDLKSLNVLLDAHYRGKLTDFGLSKMKLETASSTQHKEGSAGTLLWMAPELFQRHAKHTKETDIYSLGMVFWEMAARALPFQDAPSPSVVPTWIKDGEREDIPPNCPSEFGSLIKECWAQDPNTRPTLTIIITQLRNLMNSLKGTDQSQLNPQYTGPTLFRDEANASGAGPYLGNLESGYSSPPGASASTSDYMDNLASHRPMPS